MGRAAMNLLPYLGPWCCEKGQALGVPVCPECEETNIQWQSQLGADGWTTYYLDKMYWLPNGNLLA
jgi:hypothetical protein